MDTVVCDNCAKEIPSQSYELHHIHCLRNIVRCHCGAIIPKADKEAHDTEMHIPKPCPNCKELIEPVVFQYHDCPKKPKLCKFCEAYIPQDSYNKHVYECGSRTEMCFKCNQYIQMRDCTALPNLRPGTNRARFLSDTYGMMHGDESEINSSRAIGRYARGPDRPDTLQPARPRAASELELDPERILSNRREEISKLFEEMRSKGLADMPEDEGFGHIPELGSEVTSSSAVPAEISSSAGYSGPPYGRPNYEDQLQKAIQASLEEADTREDAHNIEEMTEEERMLNEAILKSLQEN